MTQEITVVPVDARRSDWYRLVAGVLNRLQNTTAAAGVTATWGSIAGTLSDQTDLQAAFNSKQNLLVSGTNIKTVNGSSLLGSGNLAVGTVTSVAATVPTGFSVAGSPITTTGTLAISFTAGYSLPTDASQSNWNTAYGWGNHASAGYLTTSVAASTYQPLDGDLTSLAGASGTNTIYYRSAANTWSAVTVGSGLSFTGGTLSASGGGGTPGGSSGQIQYNNAGAFGGSDLSGDVTTSGSLATAIAANAVTTTKINNAAVTLAKIANAAASSKLLGSGASGSGSAYAELTLGTNLSMSGTTLNAAGITALYAQATSGSVNFKNNPANSAIIQPATVTVPASGTARVFAVMGFYNTGSSGGSAPALKFVMDSSTSYAEARIWPAIDANYGFGFAGNLVGYISVPGDNASHVIGLGCVQYGGGSGFTVTTILAQLVAIQIA